jgi:hypothetical protein
VGWGGVAAVHTQLPNPAARGRLLRAYPLPVPAMFHRSVALVTISVQLSPLHALVLADDNGKCAQPGCSELSVGHVPWGSLAVTLVAPWLAVFAVAQYLSTGVLGAVTVVTFAGLTLPDLSTTSESVAVVAATIVSAAMAAVSWPRCPYGLSVACGGWAGWRMCMPVSPSRRLHWVGAPRCLVRVG